MSVIPLTHVFHESMTESTPSRRAIENTRSEDDAQPRATMCGVLLQMALTWPVILNRDAVDFARGIAEILVWSAEHARSAAIAKTIIERGEGAEWICAGCGETSPENFELCWNCERERAV